MQLILIKETHTKTGFEMVLEALRKNKPEFFNMAQADQIHSCLKGC